MIVDVFRGFSFTKSFTWEVSQLPASVREYRLVDGEFGLVELIVVPQPLPQMDVLDSLTIKVKPEGEAPFYYSMDIAGFPASMEEACQQYTWPDIEAPFRGEPDPSVLLDVLDNDFICANDPLDGTLEAF
jgi:hypothetical protein